MNKCYKEVTMPNDGKTMPVFPQACPICKAGVKEEIRDSHWFNCKITYNCGGAYVYKPQIQNHTNKLGGYCKKVEK